MPTNIRCDYVQKNLSAYYDKELGPNLYKEIQEHLRECITCRREFSNIAKTAYQLMQAFEKVDMPEIIVDIDKALECHFVLDNLDEYVDRQLPKKDMSKISEHILNCKSCRDDYEDLKKLKKITKWYFSVFKMPSNVVNCKKLVQDSMGSSPSKVAWTSVACLAGALFLMLLSAMLFSPDNINPPEIATKEPPVKQVIRDSHEIQVSNVKTLNVD